MPTNFPHAATYATTTKGLTITLAQAQAVNRAVASFKAFSLPISSDAQVGDLAWVRAHGQWRRGLVVKVNAMRITVVYRTRSTPADTFKVVQAHHARELYAAEREAGYVLDSNA